MLYNDIERRNSLRSLYKRPCLQRYTTNERTLCLHFIVMGLELENNFTAFHTSLWIMFKYFSHHLLLIDCHKGFCASNVLCQQKCVVRRFPYVVYECFVSYMLKQFFEDHALNWKWPREFSERCKMNYSCDLKSSLKYALNLSCISNVLLF